MYGLFSLEPRDRVIASGGEGHRFTVKADRAYLHRSVRTPHDELAIAEITVIGYAAPDTTTSTTNTGDEETTTTGG